MLQRVQNSESSSLSVKREKKMEREGNQPTQVLDNLENLGGRDLVGTGFSN